MFDLETIKYMNSKTARTNKAIENCNGSLWKIRHLMKYTKADQSLIAGKKFGGLLDANILMDKIAIYVIEKELLDGEFEEHIFD